MISTRVGRHSRPHGMKIYNAASITVFGESQFIDLESDSSGTSTAIKIRIISDLKKSVFGLTSLYEFMLALFLIQNSSARPQANCH